jgi:TetR/AcrR family transcriptional regulator, repressor of fatR-cypB operon
MLKDSLQIKPTRRERERLSKREEILTAARKVFAEKGFEKATLDEIAQVAEFGKGTIYNYFSSKETLFDGILDMILSAFIENAARAIAEIGSARDRLGLYAKSMIEFYRTNSDLFRIMVREMNRMELEMINNNLQHIRKRVRELSEILAEAIIIDIQEKHLKPLDPNKLAMVFIGMVHSFCMIHLNESRSIAIDAIDDAVDFLITVFFDGISCTSATKEAHI